MSGKRPAAGTTGREKAVCCLIRNPHTGHSHPQQCHTRLYIIGKCPVCLSVCVSQFVTNQSLSQSVRLSVGL